MHFANIVGFQKIHVQIVVIMQVLNCSCMQMLHFLNFPKKSLRQE